MGNSRPVFRNPDIVQLQPWRQWMREECPSAAAGFVPEDLDLVILTYSGLVGRPRYKDGRFLLADIKYNGKWLGYAQRRVFGKMHKLFRQSDPHGQFYRGFYVIHWNEVSGEARNLWDAVEDAYRKGNNGYQVAYHRYFQQVYVGVNGQGMGLSEFKRFLLGDLEVPSLELLSKGPGISELETLEVYQARIEASQT